MKNYLHLNSENSDGHSQICSPFGPLIYKNKISINTLEEILSFAKYSKEEVNYSLAGNIDKEVLYEPSNETMGELISYVNEYVQYMNTMGIEKLNNLPKKSKSVSSITIEPMWINVQRRGEWNPVHTHTGDMSCIIYAKVPQELKNEWKHPNQRGNAPTAGKLQFVYGEYLPMTIAALTMEPEERDIYIFPSWLQHHVYPFNSDVERISCSGNFSLKYDNKNHNNLEKIENEDLRWW